MAGFGTQVAICRNAPRECVPMSDLEARLAKAESELVRLRTENEQLRRSAQAFGELAERLNRALLIATAARHAQAGMPARGLPTAGKD